MGGVGEIHIGMGVAMRMVGVIRRVQLRVGVV